MYFEYEEWRDVPGYEGVYEASSTGKVRSKDRVTEDGRAIKGKTLKPSNSKTDGKGYWQVQLSKGGAVNTIKVHKIIASTFVRKPEGKEFVGFADGNKSNLHADNVRWMTRQETMDNARSNRANEQPVMQITRALLNTTDSIKSIASEFGVTTTVVESVDKGVQGYKLVGHDYPLRATQRMVKKIKMKNKINDGYTAKEVARMFSVNVSTVYKAIKE